MDAEQKHADAVVSTCTCLNLKKAARAASQILESHLAPLGLHSGQFGILSHLVKTGPVSVTRLADALTLDRTTLTRNLQVLERDGLIVMTSGQDRRVREAALTAKGRRVFEEAIPLWQRAEASLAERLGPERRQALLSHAAALTALAEK